MERMMLQEPYRTGQNHGNAVKYILAGMAVLCNCSDIVQWNYDMQGVGLQQNRQNVKATVFEPHINDFSVRGSFMTILRSFRELETGWDGYDALPLESGSFDNAAKLIRTLPDSILDAWKMFPSDNGTVLMVLKKRVLATVNIGHSTVSYVAKSSDGRIIKRGRDAFDVDAVVSIMSEMVAAFE